MLNHIEEAELTSTIDIRHLFHIKKISTKITDKVLLINVYVSRLPISIQTFIYLMFHN